MNRALATLIALALVLTACAAGTSPTPASATAAPAAVSPSPPLLTHERTPVRPAAGVAYPAVPLPPARAAVLEAALAAAAQAQRAVGVSAAVLVPGAGTWTGATGWADLAQEAPMTPDSRLAVASVTKTFVASLVLLLAHAGILSLDAPIRSLLPVLPPTVSADVTVRELLDHTSGVADYIDAAALLLAASRSPATAIPSGTLLGAIPAPLFAAGRGWAYSNANYLILGLALEHVTGRSLASLIRDRLTGPLGLASIRYQPEEDPGAPLTVGYSATGRGSTGATDVDDGLMPNRAFVDIAASAGGISATALDLARWGAALYGGRVLPDASLDAMLRFLPDFDYGLGAQRRTIGGAVAVGHHGRTVGYASALDDFVGSGIVIVVLANSDTVDVTAIVRSLATAATG